MTCVIAEAKDPIPIPRGTLESALIDVVNSAHLGVVIIDEDMRYVYRNDYLCKRGGKVPEDFIGMTLDELGPSPMTDGHRRLCTRGFSEGAFSEEILDSTDTDGSIVHWNTTCRPLTLSNGKRALGFVAVDITMEVEYRRKLTIEREKADSELIWSRKILNVMPCPVVLLDPETKSIIWGNDAARSSIKSLGVEAQWESIWEARDARGGPPDLKEGAVIRAARGEEFVNLEMVWHTKDGERRFMCNSVVVPASKGHEKVSALTFAEVTHLHVMEEDLRRALKGRDEFISIAAHELRTPLSNIYLQTESIRRMTNDKPVLDGLSKTLRSVKKVSELISVLLDMSRISHGEIPLDIDRADAVEVVREAALRLWPEADRSGCHIDIQTPSEVIGAWDRIRLDQVVTNLLTNAIKYGNKSPVRVTLVDGGENIIISVKDGGVGISQKDQAKIFDQFQRVGELKRAPGLGLGLWIVHHLVRQMEGSISVSSRPNEGSCFSVVIPKGSTRPRPQV